MFHDLKGGDIILRYKQYFTLEMPPKIFCYYNIPKYNIPLDPKQINVFFSGLNMFQMLFTVFSSRYSQQKLSALSKANIPV